MKQPQNNQPKREEPKLAPGRYFSFKKMDAIESQLTVIDIKKDGSVEIVSTKADLPRILIAQLLEQISLGYNNDWDFYFAGSPIYVPRSR